MYMPGSCVGHKRASYTLALELQVAISHHVGTGNWNGFYVKAQMPSTAEPSKEALFL